MIRNYTSTVPATKSVVKMEQRLVEAGANNITKFYVDGKLSGVTFTIYAPGRGPLTFKLPARVDDVRNVLAQQIKRPHKKTIDKLFAQAERCAWKNLSDWVDIQLALVRMGQASTIEIFMPYILSKDGERTLFEALADSGFKQLEW